jgi:hypothetical protein
MKITDDAKRQFLTLYVPDTRGVTVSRFGRGNLKIGMEGVYTYSRLPGVPTATALGIPPRPDWRYEDVKGTCPGATAECQAICYAARPVTEKGPVYDMWRRNSETEDVPQELPPDAKIVRIHVSGDFTSAGYIAGWYRVIDQHPQVRFFAYTRSWRIPELLPHLEMLRELPNLQLFASMDKSTVELPPRGWRRAWIAEDSREYEWGQDMKARKDCHTLKVFDGVMTYLCPEQTGRKPNCEACRYCIDGKRGDVTFLQH